MRRLTFLLLIFVAQGAAAFEQATLCGPHTDYVPIAKRAKPGMLFIAESCNKPVNYLFGTLHSDDPMLVNAQPVMVAALEGSKLAVFEMIDTPQAGAEAVRHLLLPKDQTLTSIVGAEAFAKFTGLMKRLDPASTDLLLNHFRPWAGAILLQYPPSQADGRVLDMRLQDIAREKGIALLGLETAAEQFGFFERLSLEEQLMMFSDAVEHFDEGLAQNDELTTAYIKGDLATIEKLSDKAFDEIEDQAFAKKLEHFLIAERTKKMLIRLRPRLHSGNVFVAVGALHLPGKDGLLAGLEALGYLISQP